MVDIQRFELIKGKLDEVAKGRHHHKINVLIRALPESGGGVYPCPNFVALFFQFIFSHQKRHISSKALI